MKKILFIASIALSLCGPVASSYATSMGTSRNRTEGGQNNIVKLSVLSGNSLPASRQIVGAINAPAGQRLENGYWRQVNTKQMVTEGFVVAHPQVAGIMHLGAEIKIEPFKQGARQLLTPHEAFAIARRIDHQVNHLEETATRLHEKVEITDQQLAAAKTFANTWRGVTKQLDVVGAALEQHKVAVAVDQ